MPCLQSTRFLFHGMIFQARIVSVKGSLPLGQGTIRAKPWPRVSSLLLPVGTSWRNGYSTPAL